VDRRRFLVTSLAGALATPLAAEAQGARKVRIGYLSGNPRSDTQQAVDAFRARLHDLGYVEGQNLVIEYRYADGKYERLPQLAAELVRLKVDAIFAFSTPGARAARCEKCDWLDSDRLRCSLRSNHCRPRRDIDAARREQLRHVPR